MARKTKEEAERTRQSLLNAAEEVFREKGVAHSSLEQIARRAGCTRGAVYWHFENKVDLLEALFDRTRQHLYESFESAVMNEHVEPIAALRAHVVGTMRDLAQDHHARATLEILFFRCEYVDEMTKIVEQQRQNMHWFIKNQTVVLKRAQALGQVRGDLDMSFASLMLHSMMLGLVRDWLFTPETRDIAKMASMLFDHLMESFGYRRKPVSLDANDAPVPLMALIQCNGQAEAGTPTVARRMPAGLRRTRQ